jgi:hypothetical protein
MKPVKKRFVARKKPDLKIGDKSVLPVDNRPNG